jgi:transposase
VSDIAAKIAALEAVIAAKDAENQRLREQITALGEQIRRLVRGRFAPTSEKMIHDQGQQSLDLGAAGPPEITASDQDDEPRLPKARRKPRRRRLADAHPDLQIVEQFIELPAHQRFDADGTPLVAMGREVTDLIATDLPRVYIKRLVRIRYGRADTCEKIVTAALPTRISARGMLDDSTIHRIVVAKFEDCLPLHRQERIFARWGIHLPRSLLMDNVGAWADAMTPIADAVRDEVLSEPVVHADDSVMRMLDPTLTRRCRTTNLWALTAGGQVAYHWTPDRTHARANEVLREFTGFLVRDEWQGWTSALDGDRVIHVGCNAHARRPFAEFQAIDSEAAAMVERYARLYAVEHAAVASGLTGPALWDHRRVLRQQRSRPIMDEIRAHAQRLQRTATPASTIGRGATYIVKHWRNLMRFLDDGRLPPDNNLAENVLRQVAVLRKNCLFLGSPDGGRCAAVALTILRSCRLQGLDHERYLADVTAVVLTDPARAADLTPAAYARRLRATAAA